MCSGHFVISFVAAMLVVGHVPAGDGRGCPLDHFAIGQLGGEGSNTGQLFADVDELYLTTERKDYPSHYPLYYNWVYDAYVNGEPGSVEIENDAEHELAGAPEIDYDVWLEIVELSDDFWVGVEGAWYSEGDRIHLSNVPGHHLHMDYWIYASAYTEDELIYVVYRLHDELADGQQYDPSEEFCVVFNRPVPGDVDADGHIDLRDYARFQNCFSGPDTPQTEPQCHRADEDRDGDVDLDDFTMLPGCMSGPDEHPDPRCAD